MKRMIIIYMVSMVILACNKNNIPTISRREADPPSRKSSVSQDFVADVTRGRRIFENRCDRCHALYQPSDYTKEKWDTILTIMAPRARLSAEETANVAAYLKGQAR